MKRAQITVFIIIGAMVIIAFGIALYAGANLSKRVQSKETQQRMEQLGIQPIQDYINTCLQLATTEGLERIGRQGGAIYASQGGTIPDWTEKAGDNYIKYTDAELGSIDVAFMIIPPNGTVGTLYYSEPPEYPFPGFPHADGKLIFQGFYGISRLPPLYKKKPTGEEVANSIQENLERYIAKRTTECATWATFEQKGYAVSAGAATASLIFANQTEQFAGEQNINIELNWPVEITTPAGDKTLLTDFAIKLPIRLATIYYTVKQIIDADVTDVSYSPENTGAFTTTKLPYGQDSFVSVTDKQSVVTNKPFEFWIPRKNRRPALWQIEDGLKEFTFHITKEGRGATINVVRINDTDSQLEINDPCPEEQEPIIKLRANDPDEDPVSFTVYIPGSDSNEIPADALGMPLSITIFAKDKSSHPDDWFDSQEIPLQVTLCEEQ